VGVFFLLGYVSWVLGDEALSGPILNASDYLINVDPNKARVIIAVLLWVINAAAVDGIAVLLFPIFKKQNEALALGYFGARIIEAAILIVGEICRLSLITLSQEFVKAGTPDSSYFQTLGTLFFAGHDWAYKMGMIATGLGGLMFCYLLYKSKLIPLLPRVIAVWGLIGYVLLLTEVLFEIFGLDAGMIMILLLPGGLFELFLGIWLIVKGFNPSAIASQSAKTDINEIK